MTVPLVSSFRPSAEFQAKSEDKDGNSLALQFLSGEKVTVVASKTSRESDSCSSPSPQHKHHSKLEGPGDLGEP